MEMRFNVSQHAVSHILIMHSGFSILAYLIDCVHDLVLMFTARSLFSTKASFGDQNNKPTT